MPLTVPQIARVAAHTLATIQRSKVLETLAELSGHYRQAMNHALWPDGTQKAIKVLRERLAGIFASNAAPANWAQDERELYERLGANALIGPAATLGVNRLFEQHLGRPDHTAAALEKHAEAIVSLRQHLNWQRDALDPLGTLQLPPDRFPLVAVYPRNLTLTDLAEVAKDWSHVCASAARVAGEKPDPPEVFEIRRGSTFIEWWVAGMVTLQTIGSIYSSVVEHVRKKRERETAALSVPEGKLREMMREAAREELAASRTAEIEALFLRVFRASVAEDRQEVRNALETSVDRVEKFIDVEDGRLSLPSQTDGSAEVAGLAAKMDADNKALPLTPSPKPPAQIGAQSAIATGEAEITAPRTSDAPETDAAAPPAREPKAGAE
jgi:hypothetical protein